MPVFPYIIFSLFETGLSSFPLFWISISCLSYITLQSLFLLKPSWTTWIRFVHHNSGQYLTFHSIHCLIIHSLLGYLSWEDKGPFCLFVCLILFVLFTICSQFPIHIWCFLNTDWYWTIPIFFSLDLRFLHGSCLPSILTFSASNHLCGSLKQMKA